MIPRILFTGLRVPHLEPADAAGVDLLHLPAIAIVPCTPEDENDAAAFLARRPRIVFPSRSAVEGLAAWLASRSGSEPAPLAGLECWAVGEATAAAVRESFGLEPRLPARGSAAGIVEELEKLDPRPVLLVAGESRRPEIPDWLARRAIEHLELRVYRTEVQASDALRQAFRDDPRDWIVFTSPTTVHGFLRSLHRRDLSGLVARLASIGPTTSAEIAALAGSVAYEAERPDAGLLVREIARRAREASGRDASATRHPRPEPTERTPR